MSTDATGIPTGSGALANQALDAGAEVTTRAGAREVRRLDDRLVLLLARMTIAAFAFFFACFYFAQVYLQIVNENGQWLPAGVNHPPLWIGISEVVLILAAGLVYFWGQWAGLYQRAFNRLNLGRWGAALLTLASFGIHVYEIHAPGFSLQGGGYVSVFIALEGTFTVLMAITFFVLLGMANRSRLGLFRESGVAVEAFGEYFGFFSAIALMNFLALYVQPFFPSA